MAYSALDNPYVLNDQSARDLLAIDSEEGAPVAHEGFESRAADSDRLSQLTRLLTSARSS